MKLSEMPTREAAAAIARIGQPVAVIMDDKKTEALFKRMAGMKKKNVMESFAAMLPEALNLLLQAHFNECAAIIAVLSGKTAEEVANQPFKATVADVRDCLDGDLLDFFKSSGAQTLPAVN